MGQVLRGMDAGDPGNPDKKLVPVAWTKTHKGARVFTTTMGHAGDLQNEGVRRMLVNACYWALGMEEKIPARNKVDLVGNYAPNDIGLKKHKTGLKPADLRM
jgi:type 1 glutamine amidotransferase